MSGPWGILFKALHKQAGKSARELGKKAAQDVRAADRAVKVDYSNAYSDLTKDSGVSASWLDKLIGRSKNPDQVDKLYRYLSDSDKTANLDPSARVFLFKKIGAKLQAIDQETVAKLTAHREKIKSLLEFLEDTML